ncbi:T9SS type A sorting domain-containing protein [candidate division KSB1 bacterium]|nr:T9SS type A sorting domain-containing protein [candidate division KSB1 bacterium]
MKLSKRVYLLLLTLLLSGSATALEVEVYLENPQVSGSDFSWDISFKPVSGWTGGALNANEYLNSASWYFTFNNAALTNPVITNSSALVSTHYDNTTGITGGNKVYVSTGELSPPSGPDPQHVTEGTKYFLYTITMTITDGSASSLLAWDQANTAVENYAGAIAVDGDITFTGSGDITLPVELSTFSATPQTGSIRLNWTTASEQNNLGFNIYRSKDEEKFEKINGELIRGAGTSSDQHNYSFVDNRIQESGVFYYKLEQKDINGFTEWHGPISVELDESFLVPTEFILSQNYPNPFNPKTIIRYGLAAPTHVKLEIYNMRGQVIATLVNAYQPAGFYEQIWNAVSDLGYRMPSGIYFYKLHSEHFTNIKKMILAK